MCGCILLHAAMNHPEQQPVTQSAHVVNVPSAAGGQRCLHCGFLLQQGFSFCPACGVSLRTMECPACGQKVEPGWGACAYCGSPLGEALRQPAQQ